jgi:hypothetical protein
MTHTNIEIIELNAYNGAFDVSDNAAVTNLNLIDATTANTFTVAAGQAVGVATMANGEVVDFAGNTVVTLGLTANALGTVAGSGVTIDLNSTAQTTLNVTSSTAASHIVLANTGAKLVTVNVAGDQATKINAETGNIALTTLNGATATGALELVIDTNTNKDIAVTGGSGDDLIVMAGTLAKGDVINGGAGNDTLSITQASMTAVNAFSAADKATMNANLSNIETIRVTDALTASFDAERYDGVNNYDLVASYGVANNTVEYEISNLASGATITLRELEPDSDDTLKLTVKDATAAGNNSDVINLVLNDAAGGGAVNVGAVNLVGIETLNITTANTTLAGVAGTTTSYVLDIATTSASLNTINVSGTEGINLGTNITNTIETISAAGVIVAAATDAGLTVGVAASGTQGVVIIGTGGIDTVTGGAASDVVTLGAGADVYTVTTGNDVVTLGDGIDDLKITEALFIANSGTTATFDGGAGTDTITLSEDAVINVVDADFRGLTSFETLITANGTNNLVLGANADATGITTITGGTGADTIDLLGAGAGGFDNITTINLGAGNDVLTLGGGVDTVTAGAVGSSTVANGIAASGGAHAGGDLIATDVIDLSTGVDRILNFSAADKINVTTAATAPTNVVTAGLDINGDVLVDDTTYVIYGSFNSGTGAFTVAASFASAGGVGVADAIVVEGDGTLMLDDTTGYVVIEDLSAALAASNFV